jgi:hypothetical protein
VPSSLVLIFIGAIAPACVTTAPIGLAPLVGSALLSSAPLLVEALALLLCMALALLLPVLFRTTELLGALALVIPPPFLCVALLGTAVLFHTTLLLRLVALALLMTTLVRTPLGNQAFAAAAMRVAMRRKVGGSLAHAVVAQFRWLVAEGHPAIARLIIPAALDQVRWRAAVGDVRIEFDAWRRLHVLRRILVDDFAAGVRKAAG